MSAAYPIKGWYIPVRASAEYGVYGDETFFTREQIVELIIQGQFEDLDSVVFVNPVKQLCDDVTREIQLECIDKHDSASEYIDPFYRDMIDYNATSCAGYRADMRRKAEREMVGA